MEPNSIYTTDSLRNSLSVASGTSNTALTTTSGTTTYLSPNSSLLAGPISQSFNLTPQNQIMQNKVAVFKVTRDEDQKITKTEFIKELWVETKNGQSVDFQVARDKDLAEYEMSELSIRTIYTVTF
jgi:hypothetical protein